MSYELVGDGQALGDESGYNPKLTGESTCPFTRRAFVAERSRAAAFIPSGYEPWHARVRASLGPHFVGALFVAVHTCTMQERSSWRVGTYHLERQAKMPGTSFPKARPIRRSGEMRKAQEPGQRPGALPEGVPGLQGFKQTSLLKVSVFGQTEGGESGYNP